MPPKAKFFALFEIIALLSSGARIALAQPVNPNSNVGNTTTIQNPGVVSWVHIGDLHITTGDQQNYTDFQTITQHVNQYLLNGINFAVLPGDNANDGSESEYQLIRQAVNQLQAPLFAVPGDHDLKSGSLTLFEKYLEPVPYQSFSADRYHFVFLDALDASSSGGFGIGSAQLAWLTGDLAAASKQGLQPVLFMHAFPSALSGSAQTVLNLIQQYKVLMVDVGHTHFNEVANDNHTIYAATRSTGQVTEGPVGFSIANLDNGVVSWKFKVLGSWPFVMITSPADKQLLTDPAQPNQAIRGTVDVRAKIWDDKGVASATWQIDNGAPQPLARIGTTQMWSASWDSTQVADGDHQITVNVQGAGGNTSEDKIYILVNQAGTYQPPPRSPGDQGNSIGASAEKGLLGTTQGGGGGGSAPKPGPAGVANAAGGYAGVVAPGEIISIYGSQMGPSTAVGGQLDSSGNLTTLIGGVQVTFDGVPAPLFYAQANQINTQVPYSVAGKTSTTMQVVYNGGMPTALKLSVATVAPGVFTDSGGAAAALNQYGSLNSSANPAASGSVVVLYGTGEGQTTPASTAGHPALSPSPRPIQPVAISIDGRTAQVLSAVEAPGFSSLLQINVSVPPSSTATAPQVHAAPVTLTIGNASSQRAATVWVR